MKTRLIFTALMIAVITCCWNPPLEAALPAGAQWEVRTTGNDLNGGFFNTAGGSGTDYSQQDAAQLTVTDGVTSTTTLTSITGGFTAAMVHNGVQLSGGTCTAGIYEITVVTNSNTVTIDSSGGAAGAGCTVKVGGGLLTIAKALAKVVWVGGLVYNGVWIKSGTYTLTASLTTPSGVYNITGYQATHGDNGTKPLITTATNSTPLIVNANLGRPLINNLAFSNTAAVRSYGISVTAGMFMAISNCTFDGFASALYFGTNNTSSPFAASAIEVKNSTGDGVLLANTTAKMFSCAGCYIHDNAGAGISDTGGSSTTVLLTGSILAANGGGGLVLGDSVDLAIMQNSTVAGNTGAGVLLSNGGNVYSYNSIYYNNTTYGISNPTTNLPSSAFGLSNAYGANGTAPTLNFPAGTGDVTLSANPFTSSTNFALNATAGGGAALKAVGFPGAFIGGTTTGYPDIGAVQSQASAGGGGASFAFVQ